MQYLIFILDGAFCPPIWNKHRLSVAVGKAKGMARLVAAYINEGREIRFATARRH